MSEMGVIFILYGQNRSDTPTIEERHMQYQGLKQRSDIHLTRKLAHCVSICLMAVIFNMYGYKVSWTILICVSLFIIPLDILRQKNPGLNRATLRVFGPFMRASESNKVSGMTWLYCGCAALLLFHNVPIITLTLLFLAFGDPIASFFGIRYGKDRIIGNKTLQGTMAAFVVCTIITGIYCYFNNLMTERLFIVAPLGGLIAAAAELCPIGKLDDNFTFPVLAAALLSALFFVFSS